MKIIISDFDNTLFTEAYEDNIKAIKEFRKKGNKFAIATGRPLYFLKPDLKDLEVDYFICSDGTVVFDKFYNILYSMKIDKNTASNVIDCLMDEESVEDWYINEPYQYSKNLNGEINGILGKPIIKQHKLVEKINNEYNDVHTYLSTKWINIVPKGISKKDGIIKLMEIENIKHEQIITVGDNLNDIEMNKYFESYCVKDSKEELIKTSKYKVDHVYEIIKKVI